MSRAASFPPVVRADCRLLVLGSLPGTASLSAGRYYAHPRNQFWRLMGAALEADLESQAYEARLETLLTSGIGLWDVIGAAHRPGSLDSAIRNPQANDLAKLVAGLPTLRAVAFNGAAAFLRGSPLLADKSPALVPLPSTSPANARMSFAWKRDLWLVLRPFLTRDQGLS